MVLSIETSLQVGSSLNNYLFYSLAFSCTLVYYTNASLMVEFSIHSSNERSQWYAQHKKLMLSTQYIFFVIIVLSLTYFALKHFQQLKFLSASEWIELLIFPTVSFFYYGIETKIFGRLNLRTIGWLKPIVIGFVWAGLTTIYPVLYDCIEKGQPYSIGLLGSFLFLKNFIFITLLGILFDIKDYAMDYNAQLKTIVIKLGLRKTLFFLIIPLCLIGLTSFYFYAYSQHLSLIRVLINTIPFLLIMAVTYSLSSRRSIFFYLVIIDGLMLVKALCGITAMLYF